MPMDANTEEKIETQNNGTPTVQPAKEWDKKTKRLVLVLASLPGTS